ncbi:9095_t:CDS:2 [Racocetra persica]|uniref:9095_t:CDS:1 n=1 Tax=Racocetra persica TaxID=160502 RepID=A0ACA9LCT9_9GLOM|nr:9095_t:CDS:2 [Racocetra persica]
MQCKGEKPPHQLTEYFCIIPNEWANKSNRKCICRACMDVVGKEVALQDENMKITNTLCYCSSYLKDCPYFAIKYSPEQIQNIINLALVTSTSKKRMAISHIDEEDEEDSISTTSTHSSNSLSTSNNIVESFLQKQTTLSQYIGHPFNVSEVPKFERLVLCATVLAGFAFRWIENPKVRKLFQFISPYIKLPNRKSLSNYILMNATNEVQTTIKDLACNDKISITIAFDGWRNIQKEEVISRICNLFEETLVTKDDATSDNDLRLSNNIKVTVNHDSFWESLVILHNIFYPFCEALDLMQ